MIDTQLQLALAEARAEVNKYEMALRFCPWLVDQEYRQKLDEARRRLAELDIELCAGREGGADDRSTRL
jgi:hypothetical protein